MAIYKGNDTVTSADQVVRYTVDHYDVIEADVRAALALDAEAKELASAISPFRSGVSYVGDQLAIRQGWSEKEHEECDECGEFADLRRQTVTGDPSSAVPLCQECADEEDED